MIPYLALLAQETEKTGGGKMTFWIGILLMIGVFYFVLLRGNPKGRKKREQMMSELKKNDRVMTIGGILGSVVAVKDKEVVIKVDETTNTKMTFTKDAIRTIVQDNTVLTVEDK